jgi:hypothetical protein
VELLRPYGRRPAVEGTEERHVGALSVVVMGEEPAGGSGDPGHRGPNASSRWPSGSAPGNTTTGVVATTAAVGTVHHLAYSRYAADRLSFGAAGSGSRGHG